MNIDIIKRILVVFSIVGTVISIGYANMALSVLSFVAQAQERSGETEARQSAKDEANRRRSETRNLIETRRNEFKNRIGNVVSEEKQQRVLRITDSINEINKRQTNVYLNLIGRIDSFLQRAITRIRKAEQEGINMSEVRIKAEEANRVVTEARSFVMAQADRVYNIEATSKEELPITVRRVRDNLRNDIGNVRTKVKDARAAVVEVIKAINNANNQ